MSLDGLRASYTKHGHKRICGACKAFESECMVPVFDGDSMPMCWLCAHHVVDHEVPICEAMDAECECAPGDIYPRHSAHARARLQQPVVPVNEVWNTLQTRLAPHLKLVIDSSQSGLDAWPKSRSSRREALAKKRG